MDNQKSELTEQHARRLKEFDDKERILTLRLANLLERRREYINTNELNKNASTKYSTK